jgi:1-acyl-sn-glycerol-3-phosphate acyltransferase
MSTLETFVLPAIIHPIKKITFVVKKDLMEYPIFKHIMLSRDPIAVSRENPREDLKMVLDEGIKRLRSGLSIVVFPQTTRSNTLDPSQFNTIGIKLALKADVPIIPIALKTDAWGTGKIIKDFGKINPEKKVYFSFGEPLRIKGRGVEEHKRIIQFISTKLKEW